MADIKVRVGAQNAIKVLSSASGGNALFADTATNVIGGIASVTQLDVSGISTFNAGLEVVGHSELDYVNVSGGTGFVASTAKISDLTSGRVVYSGASGELQDSANLTFDGTELSAGLIDGGSY